MKKSASEIVNSNKNCAGVIISGVGHGVPLSKPDLFNRIIEKWINSGIVRGYRINKKTSIIF